jgi:exodeoxyribonuclease V alpha subunit
LLEATSDGHCALPLEKLKLAAVKLLEVPEGTVEQALSQMLTGGSLLLEEIDGEPLIFLPHLRRAEEGIAARIKSLAEAELIYPPIDFEKAVAWCERRTGKTLAPSQREALKTVLGNRVVVITGGPGVGKTTLVNSILMILRAKGVKCLLCAPLPDGRRSGSRRPRAWKPRPSTACWKSIPELGGSAETSRTRSPAAFWSWTRPRWWMCC